MRTYSFVLGALIVTTLPATAQTVLVGTPAPRRSVDFYDGKTVVPALVACADAPSLAPASSALRILSPHSPHLHNSVSRGGVVVLSGGTPQGITVGQRFFTRRVQLPRDQARVTAETPASIRTSGWLTVLAVDEYSALARIDYACTAIEAGDYLDTYIEPALPVSAGSDGETNFDDLGRVLFGPDRRAAFGAGDLLSIDRGSERGLPVGARVVFYRDRRNDTPLVEIGAGIVIEVSADTSKVVVERAADAVLLGDFYGLRRTP